MRFNVDRICELAGLGAASGGLLSEAAQPAAPAAKAPATAAAKPAAPPKAAPPASKAAPAATEDEDLEEYGHYMKEMDATLGDLGTGDIVNDAVYEIDETELAEALVLMRQQRLEETHVRDTVRDEIRRALSDKSGSWVYGSNKPTSSRMGQISRGGFGIGFGFKR